MPSNSGARGGRFTLTARTLASSIRVGRGGTYLNTCSEKPAIIPNLTTDQPQHRKLKKARPPRPTLLHSFANFHSLVNFQEKGGETCWNGLLEHKYYT